MSVSFCSGTASACARRYTLGAQADRRPAAVIQNAKRTLRNAKFQMKCAVSATAAPATQTSPFAAVDSEAALFNILKAGQSSGKVTVPITIKF